MIIITITYFWFLNFLFDFVFEFLYLIFKFLIIFIDFLFLVFKTSESLQIRTFWRILAVP